MKWEIFVEFVDIVVFKIEIVNLFTIKKDIKVNQIHLNTTMNTS